MKKRIEQLLSGQYTHQMAKLVRIPDTVKLSAKPGQTVYGSFRLSSASGERIRGFIFSPDVRVRVEPEEFYSHEIEIRYRFDIPEQETSEQIEGAFTIASLLGEDSLPFSVRIIHEDKESGERMAPGQLAALAREDDQKAYGVFLSEGFGQELRQQDLKKYSLYEGLLTGEHSYETMEQFLTAADLKHPVAISAYLPGNLRDPGEKRRYIRKDEPALYDGSPEVRTDIPGGTMTGREPADDKAQVIPPGPEESDGRETAIPADYKEARHETQAVTFTGLSRSIREEFLLKRENWGFAQIHISSDAAFLIPEKRLITTDDFSGKTCPVGYVIDPAFMHAGKNFGRLLVTWQNSSFSLEVTAGRAQPEKTPSEQEQENLRLVTKQVRARLETLFISFRLKHIRLTEWVERSRTAIRAYQNAGGTDAYADLFLIQLYYADDQKEQALTLLNKYQEHPELLADAGRYGFYRYLTTFFRQEESYVDEIEGEIQLLFSQEPSNWVLQWILLYLDEHLLSDRNARLEAVREQVRQGCRSRILYIEAFQALCEEPVLLRTLDTFERRILRFGMEEGAITADIARQVSRLVLYEREFHLPVYYILEQGYRDEPSDEMLRSICTYLMRGECKGPAWYPWYEKAVEASLRITGLYEYYLESRPDPSFDEMPQVIRMFFLYDDTLEYRKRAAIYHNIWQHRENYPQTWRMNQPALSRFLQEQLEQGHITPELGVLYRNLLRKETLSRLMQEQLTRLMFSCRVTCEVPGARFALVHSALRPEEQRIPIVQKEAVVRVYDRFSSVLVEMEDGTRVPAASCGTCSRVLEDERLLRWCMELRPHETGILQYVAGESLAGEKTEEKRIPYLREAAMREDFSDEFRIRIRRQVLRYYLDHPLDDSLSDYLKNVPLSSFAAADEAALITLLAEEGMCEQAFQLLEKHGTSRIPLFGLVRICSRMILSTEFEENRTLTALCYSCFEQGKYNDKLLRYLLMYYEGPIRNMITLWNAGNEFELDTMQLEEKILTMLLLTCEPVEGTEQIFESYAGKMGRRKLCEAYLNLKSYEYFVRGLPVARQVFSACEKQYLEQGPGTDPAMFRPLVRSLALLQYESTRPKLSGPVRDMAAAMLQEMDERDLRFSFWQRFDAELLAPYQLEGRVFLEYAGNPDSEVEICYRKFKKGAEGKPAGEETMRRERLRNRFKGIFVREFLLFPDEQLDCVLTEVLDGSTLRREEYHLRPSQSTENRQGTDGYSLLEQITSAMENGEDEKLRERLETYYTQEYLAEELFTFI